MEFYIKKRISIIVENAYTDSVIKLIEESGASGFSIYKDIHGKGRHGIRGYHGGLEEFAGNVEIFSITGHEVAERILKGLQIMIDQGISLVVHVIDVNVIRDDHFR